MTETKTKNTKLGGLTIAIEFSDAIIKAAVYDEATKIPQPVLFDSANPEFIPSVVYIPQGDVGDVLFGCEALAKAKRDAEGLVWNLKEVLSEKDRDIVVGSRLTQNKQAIVNNLIRYVKNQAEEQVLNSRKLTNCIFVLAEETSEVCRKFLTKAAKAAGFKKIIETSRVKSIANYWMFYHNKIRYDACNSLIAVDVKADQTDITFFEKSEDGFAVASGKSSSFELGWNKVADLVWSNMVEQGTVGAAEDVTDSEKISLIETVLQESIFDARSFYFKGRSIEIPATSLTKAQEDFSRLLKSGVSQYIDFLGESFGEQTELAIVMNVDSDAHISSISDELCPGNSFSPDHPGFTVALGATLPDDAAWLKSQNLMSKLKLAPGVKFGVYTILRSLGKGGMGEVWLAHHETMDIPVAIKVVHSHLTQSSDSLDRFLSEIRYTAKLRHSNIVRAHDAGCLHGIHFMVSDYVNGVSLTSKLDEGHVFSEHEVLKIGRFISDALKHAWTKHKILHRDIKPDNIMLDNDGGVMLMDMGISKSLLDKAPDLTSSDTLLGTPYYMSPEQIKGDDSDFHSDIYSLGATLYHLATGSRPYEAESIINVATMHITDPVPNAAEFNPDLSEGFVNLLQKMMAKDPDERQVSWDEVIKEIDLTLYQNEDFIEEADIKPVEEEEDEKPQRTNSILSLLTIGFALIVIMIILTTRKSLEEQLGDESETAAIRFGILPKMSKVTITKNGKVYDKYEAVLADGNVFYLTLGTYNVSVRKEGFKEQNRRVVVTGDPRLYRFSLEPYIGTKDLKIPEGFSYLLLDTNGKQVVAGTIDEGDKLSINVPVGDYKLELEKEGYVKTTADVKVFDGDNKPQTVEPKLNGGMFRLNTENSYDIYHKRVKIGSTNTNISSLQAGDYEFQIKRDGFRTSNVKVTVTDKPSYPVKIDDLAPLSGDIKISVSMTADVARDRIPTSGKVKIDNAPWRDCKLPYLLEDYRCKDYMISLKVENFIVKPETVEIWNDDEETSVVDFKLTPVPAPVLIKYPVNLPIFIGDKKIGFTNRLFYLPAFVEEKIKITREGYQDAFVDITPVPETETTVTLPEMKKRHGDLQVSMTPSPLLTKDAVLPDRVEVRINGGSWQSVKLPFSMEKLPSIDYEVELKALNYNFTPEKLKFFLKEKQVNKVNFEVFPEKLPVLIKSNVRGAKIYDVNGAELGTVGQYIRLAPFVNYDLYIRKKAYKDYHLQLLVNKLVAPRREVVVSIKREKGAVLGADWKIETLDLTMKNIKPGVFMMGDKKGKSDERNVHKVTLTENFWMSDKPITQAQFKKVMGYNPSFALKGVDCSDYPVTNISWDEAIKFCKKLTKIEQDKGYLLENDSFALPTEAEWEYCCKAGTSTPFHFGNDLSSSDANIDGTFSYKGQRGKMRGFTSKVGTFKPNAWGLYDMHGNVWEWCNDTYKHAYSKIPQVDPKGAAVISDEKVLRGGSWKSYPKDSRSTTRNYRSRVAKDTTVGFRIVLRIRD